VLIRRENIEELIEVMPELKLFMGVDVLLYILWIIWYLIMYETINGNSYYCHSFIVTMISLVAFVNAQYAFVLSFSDEVSAWENEFKDLSQQGTDPTGNNQAAMDQNTEEKHELRENALSTVRMMMYLRMIGWWAIILFCLIMCCFGCCLLVTKGSEAFNQVHETASKVPGLKTVLASKARTYDPEKDVECTECAICLTNFSVDDPKPLVELKCSNKHIFHLECMEGWIEQQ